MRTFRKPGILLEVFQMFFQTAIGRNTSFRWFEVVHFVDRLKILSYCELDVLLKFANKGEKFDLISTFVHIDCRDTIKIIWCPRSSKIWRFLGWFWMVGWVWIVGWKNGSGWVVLWIHGVHPGNGWNTKKLKGSLSQMDLKHTSSDSEKRHNKKDIIQVIF